MFVVELRRLALAEQDEWISRLRGPDREVAIEELRGLLVRGLSRSLANRGGGESFAEDVAQDSLIKILDSLDTFEGRSKFTTWALTIATRLAISELRRRRNQNLSLDSLTADGALHVSEEAERRAQGSQPLERAEILNTLSRLIDESLSDRQRVAMQALLTGVPIEEIAIRTNSNRNAVYKLIHDARKRLRDGFVQAGFTAEELSKLFA